MSFRGQSDQVYVGRAGLNWESARLIGISAAFCLVALLPMPQWMRVADVGFFGLGGLIFVALCIARPVALRVDASGITAQSSVLVPKTRMFYPWEDVAAITIWQWRRRKFVGVVRREGTPPRQAMPHRRASLASLAIIAPGIPVEVSASAVPVNGWVLRTRELAAVVMHWAPEVQIIDTTVPGSAS